MLSDQPAAGRRHPGKGPLPLERCIPPHRMSEDAQWPVYQSTQADWGRLRLWGSKPHREW